MSCESGTKLAGNSNVTYPDMVHGDSVNGSCETNSAGNVEVRCSNGNITTHGECLCNNTSLFYQLNTKIISGSCNSDTVTAGNGEIFYPDMVHGEAAIIANCLNDTTGHVTVDCDNGNVTVNGECYCISYSFNTTLLMRQVLQK